MSREVPTTDVIVMTLMIELESLFGHLFDEYFNGANQVVSKSSAVTTADASDKRQQQPDLTLSTSTLATTVTADGNFDLSYALSWKPCQGDSLNLPDHKYSIYTIKRETGGFMTTVYTCATSHIHCSDIGIQEKKAKLFNEWERFTSTDGESIESYYHRFSKLMNDFKRNKHFPEKIASNLKFLNNLQPEWSRHVTIVHQTKDLHTADYTQLYDFLKYNQKEVDDLRAERLAKTHDPLALMANSNNPFNYLVFHQDQPSSSTYMQQPLPNNNNYNPQPSFNQNYMQQPMPNPEDITDPTTAINMTLVIMAKAFKLNYLTPTNNNQRISSNPHNRQVAQPSMNMGQFSMECGFLSSGGIGVKQKKGVNTFCNVSDSGGPIVNVSTGHGTKGPSDVQTEDVGNVLVLVKFHGVPMMVFSEDRLSVIVTKLGTHRMLESYASDLFMQASGRLSYARSMIEL
ncbi:hypothetical protein Tco_0857775 [Tanacetum coccineum]|uniref:Gag-Pol polyprotein n=1 Tax=Tanacetum coccineum TaxID=301880 RepID=A0ABQ5B891_9ASTR